MSLQQAAIIGVVCVLVGFALALPKPGETELHDGVIYKYVSPWPAPIVTKSNGSASAPESKLVLPICRIEDFVDDCLANPECKKKIVLDSVEMTLTMQNSIKAISSEIVANTTDKNDIARRLKVQLEAKFGGYWNSIIGVKEFGHSVYYDPYHYVKYTVGPYFVIAYKRD